MSGTEPIKIGLLRDFIRAGVTPGPTAYPDVNQSLQLAVDEFLEAGLIDRPVEFVFRHVNGLPKGSYLNVRKAFDELVEEGCLVIHGPLISENGRALAAHVEKVAEVPIIAMCGAERMLGEWVFTLPNGSMEEEPILMAAAAHFDGAKSVGIVLEESLIGYEYLEALRTACKQYGLRITAEVVVPQVECDKAEAIARLAATNPDAVMHIGFGLGIVGINKAMQEADWVRPRYTTTAFLLGAGSAPWRDQMAGWTGVDQYDERNQTGEAFLDRYQAKYGDRPAYFWPVYAYDVARLMLSAIARAKPLSGPGVRDALERVKMLPAASGAPGTRLRFGRYQHQGYLGSGFLVTRHAPADGSNSVMHGTIDGLVGPYKGKQA